MRILRESVCILLIALIPTIATALWHPKKPEWDQTKLQEGEITLSMARKLGDNVLWVDARSQHEFDQEKIPGAIHLTEQDWDQLSPVFITVWNPNKYVIVYCASNCHSSYHVATRLREMGISPVFALKGGWDEWKKNQ